MERILVIDDDQEILNLVSKVLTHIGYEVEVAHDGEEGIRLFDSNKAFGCVVTDIHMPKINGNQVAEYIRSAAVSDIPVIAITGFDNEQIDRKLFHASLMKPFKLRTLVELIRQFTSEHQMFG
ncbi:MAG: response regulator [Desulfobacteraceae bacterium]